MIIGGILVLFIYITRLTSNEMLNTFYYQLTHTTLKNVELLKHSKISKNAPSLILK